MFIRFKKKKKKKNLKTICLKDFSKKKKKKKIEIYTDVPWLVKDGLFGCSVFYIERLEIKNEWNEIYRK